MSSEPSKLCSGRVGSIQSPWVWQRAQWGWDSPMGWVCSGTIFLGLGSLRTRGGLDSLVGLECIRQWWVPGRAPLRHGVPFPVTPWQGDFLPVWVCSCWSWRRRSATSAIRASIWGNWGNDGREGHLGYVCTHPNDPFGSIVYMKLEHGDFISKYIVNATINSNCYTGINHHRYHECHSLLGSQTIQFCYSTTMASCHLRRSHPSHLWILRGEWMVVSSNL